jgi:hypothetical protein
MGQTGAMRLILAGFRGILSTAKYTAGSEKAACCIIVQMHRKEVSYGRTKKRIEREEKSI